MAQTPQQRRANLKFAKEQEAKMGKSTEDIKKMAKKETAKAPISPIWLGMRPPPPPFPSQPPILHLWARREKTRLTVIVSGKQVFSLSSSSAE
ncbi:hypothetical protein FJTKL_13147 [Diaporthe vaccinii]|uniref:Stress-associated endoplasmic reticulum protein n=1 Tax=Diaporthe vaccinii TaxID=105482 RepID=A0ABR4EBL3_9PEZI